MQEACEPRTAQKRDQSHKASLPGAEAQKLRDTKTNQIKKVRNGWPRLEGEHGKCTIAWDACPVPPRQTQRDTGVVYVDTPREAAGLCPGNGPHHLQLLLMPFPASLWSQPGHQE